jgi:hypothetical protein
MVDTGHAPDRLPQRPPDLIIYIGTVNRDTA